MGRSHPRNFINGHCHFFHPCLQLDSNQPPQQFRRRPRLYHSASQQTSEKENIFRLYTATTSRNSATVLTSCGRSPRREKCHAGDKITLGERSSPHASVYRLVTIRESWENRGLSSNPWDYPIRGVISSKLGGLYEREVLAIGKENVVVSSKLGCLYESGISCRQGKWGCFIQIRLLI